MDDGCEIAVNRRNVTRILAAIASGLVVISVAGQLTKYLAGHDHVYGLIPLFDLDQEANIPTYFSATLLLFAAVLLWIIAAFRSRERTSYSLQWTALGLIFLCMAIDEAAAVHELLIGPMAELFGDRATGLFYFAWVIPALAVTILSGLFFLRFLIDLPSRTRSLFVLAGVLYVGGALGVEMIGGAYVEQHGFENLTYSAIATVEESLEIAGGIVFVNALMGYIETMHGNVRFSFG